MKCPECGQWNRASMPHCVRCGARLNIDEASRVSWKNELQDGKRPASYLRADEFGEVNNSAVDSRDQLAKEMQDLKRRKNEGAELQKKLRRASDSNSAPGVIVEEEASVNNKIAIRRVSAEAEAVRREADTRHRVRFMDDTGVYVESRTYDPVWPGSDPDEPRSYTLTSRVPRTLPSRIQRRKKVFRAFLIIIIAALIGAGGWFAWTHFGPGSGSGTSESPAIVTASMLDDVAAHTIMIPGEDGTSIYIRELHASYTVDDGFATVEVADHTWYDNLEGTLDETMDVTLTPFLKTSSGRQTPMDPIHYTISIPLSPITLESPDSMRTTVSTTMSTIRIVVRPGSRVLVNGNDCSDTVSSESGEMSYNATVQPIGDNVFNFVVRSQYCRDNTLTVVLYRAPQEIPLDLAVGTYGTTDEKVMKVTATTLPGAYVEVTTPHSDLNVTDLDSTGKFSFNAVFDKIGYNTISITASYPGKKPSVVEHTVYYLPPADEYTVKAWPLTAEGYSELLSNIQVRAERSQVYVITGIVQSQISDKPQIVTINTSEDGKSQPVTLRNFTNTTWVVGTYYRIYADAYSTYNGTPYLYARYTYKK